MGFPGALCRWFRSGGEQVSGLRRSEDGFFHVKRDFAELAGLLHGRDGLPPLAQGDALVHNGTDSVLLNKEKEGLKIPRRSESRTDQTQLPPEYFEEVKRFGPACGGTVVDQSTAGF